jgi:4,5-DOPA dioxygenase extradiol
MGGPHGTLGRSDQEVPVEAQLMPAAFLGHGNPMNALEHNRYTRAWQEFGASIPTPRAIVVVSAHWYIGASLVTAMASPRTIHDFYGFPRALFDVEYPAPGAADVAAEVAEVVKPRWVGLDEDGWGLDHGTWSVLVHLFPKADVPVIQLSVNGFESFDEHFELGTRLAPLREEGILILGSGNVVHNLGLVDLGADDMAFDWAVRFNESSTAAMLEDPARTGALVDHPDFALAVPTPDHFLPLAPIAGVAAAAGTPARVLVDGYVGGSLSMTSFRVG